LTYRVDQFEIRFVHAVVPVCLETCLYFAKRSFAKSGTVILKMDRASWRRFNKIAERSTGVISFFTRLA
jgi:hypothetical protein